MLKVVDGRGFNKKREGLDNRDRIRIYFDLNPGATITECVEVTGFDYKTVRRHMVAINDESVGGIA